jgi:hypothetical protein
MPANFSNPEVNELLRSMLGDSTNFDPKTKEVLITNGIIPKEDGKLVSQPPIPETKEEFFSKIPSQQLGPKPRPTKRSSTAQSAFSKPLLPQQASTANYAAPIADTNKTDSDNSATQDFSNLKDSNAELKDIQDEIKRRLAGYPQKKPADINEAKKIVRDSYAAKGRKVSPFYEQKLAESLIQPATSTGFIGRAPSSENISGNSPESIAAVAEQRAARQKNAALEGMAGAQEVLRREAAQTSAGTTAGSQQKELNKVALSVPEDPKVKLSDLFASKIDQNDPETQLLKVLLKNKSNFLLQVNSTNFKVVFDERNNFSILLESGDKIAAERLRPQLETFLKRLKS